MLKKLVKKSLSLFGYEIRKEDNPSREEVFLQNKKGHLVSQIEEIFLKNEISFEGNRIFSSSNLKNISLHITGGGE